MSHPDDHPLLTARHVDNLTEAVRTLNRTMVLLGETAQKQLVATKELTQLLRDAKDAANGAPSATPAAPSSSSKIAAVGGARAGEQRRKTSR